MKAYLCGRSYSTGGPVLDQRVSEGLFLTGRMTSRFNWSPFAGLGSVRELIREARHHGGNEWSSDTRLSPLSEVSKGHHPQVACRFSS